MARLALLVVALAAFTGYTLWVVASQGFAPLFASHAVFGWTSQVFIDLVLAVLAFNYLAVSDAKKRGIPYAPYFVATLLLGSIGVLAYLVHRELRASRVPVVASA